METSRTPLHLRRAVASVAGVVPFLYVLHKLPSSTSTAQLFDIPGILLAWGVAFIATIGLVHVNRLWAQIFVRAVWWANLVLSALMSVYERGAGEELLALSIPCAVALLVIGKTGLEPRAGQAFQPRVFQGTLVAMLIMAAADTCSLLFWGGAAATSSHVDTSIPLLIGGFVMGVACFGLYRLRGWAVFVNLGANIAIAVFASSGMFDLPKPIQVLLVTTAIGQLLVSTPLVVGVLRGQAPRAPNPKVVPILGAMAVVGLLAISVVSAAMT